MNDLASYLSAFLNEHLPRERGASPHTCQSYAYSFQLLVRFAAERHGVKPSGLSLDHLGVATVLAFLDDLEATRGCTARTRNARLAATRSFFRFLEYRLPGCLEQARQIHAIPMKRFDEALVAYLTIDEVQALLDAPDVRTVCGLRDRAILYLAYSCGWISSTAASRPASRSTAKGGASACCPCGRKPRLRSGTGLQCAGPTRTRNSSTTRPAEP